MDPTIRRSLRYSSKGYKYDPPALIHPNILVGAGEMLTPAFVKKYEITNVINCAEEIDSPSWFKEANPDKYYCLNAEDSLHVNILKWYPDFKAILKIYLQDTNSKKIFVHCQCGINRSMFLALMYVCDVFKFPFAETEFSIMKQRPCSMTNYVFRQQVFEALSKDVR
jgi:protein tyrosine phosphatase